MANSLQHGPERRRPDRMTVPPCRKCLNNDRVVPVLRGDNGVYVRCIACGGVRYLPKA